jgi:hypothetical protein
MRACWVLLPSLAKPERCCLPPPQNLVDDERFAEMFARGRWRASVRAPTQIAWVSRGLVVDGCGSAARLPALALPQAAGAPCFQL